MAQSIAFVSDRNGVSNIFLYDLRRESALPAHRLLHRKPGHHPAVAGPLLGPGRRSAGLRLLREGEVRRLHPVQPPLAEAPAVSAAGARQQRAAGQHHPGAGRHQPLAAGAGGGAPPGRRGRLDLPYSPGIPLVERGGPHRRHRLRGATDLDRGAARLGHATACPTRASSRSRTTGSRFSPDYVARPSIGYARDNFGRGFFGGTAVSLSDILGNHQLIFAGYVNGRISEAQVLAAYANLSHRINWAAGISQDPYYFLEPSQVRLGRARAGGEHLRHQRSPAGGALGVRASLLSDQPVSADRGQPAVRQRG